MSTFVLPIEGRWKTSHSGERFGSLVRTKNLSLDRDGILALARKAMVLYSLDDDAGFGNPLAIETDGTFVYIITVGHMYRMNLTASALTVEEVVATNGPTLGLDSDLVLFNGTMAASGNTDVNYLNDLGQGETWNETAPVTDLSTSFPHPLCVFENLKTLLVGDGNTVRQYSTAYARDTDNELVIPDEFIVTSIRYRGNKVTIGTRHRYGGEARLFEWNGVGASAGNGWGAGADWIYSQAEYDSSTAIVTSAGQIRRFTGAGFSDLAAFPCWHQKLPWTSTASDASLIGKVASRGMRASGSILYINIDGSISQSALAYPGTYIPEQPSGVWCFDPSAGLYHKAGYNYETRLALTVSSLASHRLVFTTAHQAQTGDPVYLTTAGLTGVTSRQVYYAIVDTTLTLRLALSSQDALAGRSIAIGGTPSTDKLYLDRYESVGQTSISSPGGLMVFGRTFPPSFFGSEIMFGGSTIDDAQTAKGVLMSLGMGRNVGSFVTPKFPATEAVDTFQKIVSYFEGINLTTDALVFKYRKRKTHGFPLPLCFSGSATWTSATTFTISTALKAFMSAEVGDEVEIVEGAGAGYTAHITDIDNSSSTYTVTIDETMPVSSGSFDFILDRWKKLGDPVTNDTPFTDAFGLADKALNDSGTWVQFKVELRGRGAIIEEMQSINS